MVAHSLMTAWQSLLEKMMVFLKRNSSLLPEHIEQSALERIDIIRSQQLEKELSLKAEDMIRRLEAKSSRKTGLRNSAISLIGDPVGK